MNTFRNILVIVSFWLLGIMLVACVTTPLPIPPTVDPERLSLSDTNGPAVEVRGGPGAVDPGDESSNLIRVTRVGEPVDGEVPLFEEVEINDDGSFVAHVAGVSSDRFYIELVTTVQDIFLLAVQGGFDGPVSSTDPGPDRDGDGSPDAIDCAPDDETISGQRCED